MTFTPLHADTPKLAALPPLKGWEMLRFLTEEQRLFASITALSGLEPGENYQVRLAWQRGESSRYSLARGKGASVAEAIDAAVNHARIDLMLAIAQDEPDCTDEHQIMAKLLQPLPQAV